MSLSRLLKKSHLLRRLGVLDYGVHEEYASLLTFSTPRICNFLSNLTLSGVFQRPVRSAAIILLILFILPNTAVSAEVSSVSFEPLSLPSTEKEKTGVMLSGRATLTYDDGKKREVGLRYRQIFRTGQTDRQGNTFGALHDRNGKPLMDSEDRALINTHPDASSAFKRGDDYFLLTHLEGYPGAVYLTGMNKLDGAFFPSRFVDVDFSAVGGTVFNCAGSKTPWDTHLGGEEDYNFDAYAFDPATVKFSKSHIEKCRAGKSDFLCDSIQSMKAYLVDREPNPYDYGHIIEVLVDSDGKSKATKKYALGRGTFELAKVLPDKKTVYLTEDGSFSGLYMFVADKAGDLSSGVLYMAKWAQRSAEDGGSAELKWVRLGRSSDREISSFINRGLVFTDIFDVADPRNCSEGFKTIRAGSKAPMCLRLRDGKNGSKVSVKFKNREEVAAAAAFLETRKYGAYLGATAEFRKGEGIAFDRRANKLYVALSSIDGSMEEESGYNDDIKVGRNLCGAVYAIDLGSANDTEGKRIDSPHAGLTMKAALSGRPLKPGDEFSREHACHPDHIAGPDNLGFYKNLLLIGEDSAFHLNNMLWAFDPVKKELVRVMTVPTGGELTGSFATLKDGKDFYIFVNIQHPLDAPTYNAKGEVTNAELVDWLRGNQPGSIGYIYGLPPE